MACQILVVPSIVLPCQLNQTGTQNQIQSIGDLKWHDTNKDEKVAKSDGDKATILQNFFFISVYC